MNQRAINRKNQEGAALITAIFAIFLATLIGFSLHYSGVVSQTIAINDRDNTEALYLADAGINHAIVLINKVPSANYSNVLTSGSNSTPDTGDELSVPPIADLWTTAEGIPAGSKTSGGVTGIGAGGAGRYWVAVRNDTATGESSTVDVNGTLILTSTGVGRNGATATVEAIYYAKSVSLPAVLINGKAKISGSVHVEGDNGILHANDILQIDGAPCADKYFSTTATIVNPSKLKGTNCNGAGFNRSSQPKIDAPVIDIRTTFYGKTTYILGAINAQAGKVYSGNGTLIVDTATTGNKWTNTDGSVWSWDATNKLWIQSGTKITNGSYYSEGNIAITGSFGTKGVPARATFIAEGLLYNQGKQYIAPSYLNYSLVAGTDIKLSGKLTSAEIDDLEVEGLTYAHDQIDFSGTPTLRGSVVAANLSDANSPGCNCNLVPLDSGYMKINGNPTIVSDTGVVFNSGTKLLSWREVRY